LVPAKTMAPPTVPAVALSPDCRQGRCVPVRRALHGSARPPAHASPVRTLLPALPAGRRESANHRGLAMETGHAPSLPPQPRPRATTATPAPTPISATAPRAGVRAHPSPARATLVRNERATALRNAPWSILPTARCAPRDPWPASVAAVHA